MRRRLLTAAVAGALCAAAAGGCGLGEGESRGKAQLSVTRDYGAVEIVAASDEVSESDTVMRLLERHADVNTRYGGRFVQSINGIAGDTDGGRSRDWFFYVNGIESSLGAAEVEVGEGDRVWWDNRDWTDAMRVPAVVGVWPEPFVHGFGGNRFPVAMGCVSSGPVCREAGDRLAGSGVEIGDADALGVTNRSLRLLVGPWEALRGDPVASLLEKKPAQSGVFSRFTDSPGRIRLLVLDQTAAVARELGPGGGLVAALRRGDEPPTWVITGTDTDGVAAAVELLSAETLRHRYAVAVAPRGDVLPAPLVEESR